MNDRIFADTNILVYAVSDDLSKRAIAQDLLLRKDVMISPQVVSEFIAVTSRKRILEPLRVVEYARKFMITLAVTVLTANTIALALDVMTKYQFSYWDSLILAAALENDCTLVYSEDLQDGQRIEDQLVIVNPF